MSEKNPINFTIVADENDSSPRIYANFCNVAHTPFDVTLTFCEIMPLSQKDIESAKNDKTVRASRNCSPITSRANINSFFARTHSRL